MSHFNLFDHCISFLLHQNSINTNLTANTKLFFCSPGVQNVPGAPCSFRTLKENLCFTFSSFQRPPAFLGAGPTIHLQHQQNSIFQFFSTPLCFHCHISDLVRPLSLNSYYYTDHPKYQIIQNNLLICKVKLSNR